MSTTTWPYTQVRQAPGEGQGVNAAIGTGTTPTLVARVPSGHANTIEVMVQSDVNVTPRLVIYGASGQISVTVALAGVTGGTPALVVHTAGCGQFYDVTINNASGGSANVKVWTAAKA